MRWKSLLLSALPLMSFLVMVAGVDEGLSSGDRSRRILEMIQVAYMNGSIDAFRIAGGVIFFGIGLDMLQSRPVRWRTGIGGEETPATPSPEEDDDPSILARIDRVRSGSHRRAGFALDREDLDADHRAIFFG